MSDEESKQWYTNKELHKLIVEMSRDFEGLRADMRATRETIKKYNGLRKDIEELRIQVLKMESIKQGASKFGESIRSWGGWIFGLITLLVLLYTTFIN